jgi:hypothetical protein
MFEGCRVFVFKFSEYASFFSQRMSLSSQIIALNSKTNGKDKIYRSVQYACKLIWYILWKKKSNHEYIEILKKLEAAMSSTRKSN